MLHRYMSQRIWIIMRFQCTGSVLKDTVFPSFLRKPSNISSVYSKFFAPVVLHFLICWPFQLLTKWFIPEATASCLNSDPEAGPCSFYVLHDLTYSQYLIRGFLLQVYICIAESDSTNQHDDTEGSETECTYEKLKEILKYYNENTDSLAFLTDFRTGIFLLTLINTR